MVRRERVFGSVRLEFQYCFGFSFVAMIKYSHRKQPLGGRGYLSSQLQVTVYRSRSQGGRNLKQLVTRCQWNSRSLLLSSLSLLKVQDPNPGNLPHSGLEFLTSTNEIKSVLPQANLMHTVPHWDSSQEMLDCVMLTIEMVHHKSFSRKKIFTLSNKYEMILDPCNRNQDVKGKEMKEIRVKSAGKLRRQSEAWCLWSGSHH